MSLTEFITGMPKAELHLHLEGTLEPTLIRTLADRNGVEISSAEYSFTDLTSFLAVYYPNMSVLLHEQDFYDLAWAYLQKAHSQNVVHVELFFDPQAHTSRGVSFPTVIEGYHRAVAEARETLGMSVELILCILRDHSVASAEQTLAASLPYKDWIVGLGLDSDERDNPPSKFAGVFAAARAEGYKLTMHCDIDQVGSIDNIRSVIYDIGVDRIDHGTNIVEDPDLVAEIVARGIGLTSCPVSNGFVTAKMKSDELVQLLRQGVKIMVNSDDPAYFKAYVTENLLALHEATDLSRDEFVLLQRNGFEISWVSDERRAELLAGLEAYAAAN
ncbi:adenosine deaminase [soil metagenome]